MMMAAFDSHELPAIVLQHADEQGGVHGTRPISSFYSDGEWFEVGAPNGVRSLRARIPLCC